MAQYDVLFDDKVMAAAEKLVAEKLVADTNRARQIARWVLLVALAVEEGAA